MCGISGIIGNATGKVTKIELMNNSLIHRGPDGAGIFISENGEVAFGHRRLSIIEISDKGSQPMQYIGRYTITYNGEIYNYIELKEIVLKHNQVLDTVTDTEIILALFHLYKEKCLSFLDGMFAFAIYDNQTNTTFIARDRFGEKPFYYHQTHDCFYFASEMKALWSIGIAKNPNKKKVFDYLHYNDIDNINNCNDTYYKDIFKLPPASYAIIDNAQLSKLNKYWQLDFTKINSSISFVDATREFKRLLENSIKLRMRSDVSLGSSLSGGIDSTIIVSSINRYLADSQKQKTFSARFRNYEKDESYYIDTALKSLKNTEGYDIYPTASSFCIDLNKLVYHQEEPFRTASQYNQFCVMKLASENNVVVLLDGQGADEILGGYLEYYFHHLTNLVYKNPWKAYKEIKNYQKVQSKYRPYRIPRKLPFWLLQKQFGKKLVYDESVREQLSRDTTSTHLPTLLRYGDKNSMAFSREVRLPFLSHELVEFVFSLPIEFILYSGWTKYILRNAYKNEIPSEIAWRVDKIGFEPPQEMWMQSFKNEIEKARKNIDLSYFGIKQDENLSDWKWLMLNRYFN